MKIYHNGKHIKNPIRVRAGNKAFITRVKNDRKEHRKLVASLFIIGIAILVVAFAPTDIVHYTKTKAQSIIHSEPYIGDLISMYAKEYEINGALMYKLIECESAGTFDPTIQSRHIKDGIREDSWGLAQIFLPAHPEITKEQAQDMDYSLQFIARNFQEGNYWMWVNCMKKISN